MTSEFPFYIVGGTLPTNAPSYVMRQADEDLYVGLSQGDFCSVLTSRQMGKSSLMTRIAARLRTEGFGVVVLDLTEVGLSVTVEQWYYGLLRSIGSQLNLRAELRDFWQAHAELGPLQRWMTALREVVLARHAGWIVIFIDEIEQTRSLPFATDEFFAGIRECYNRRTQAPELNRLVFCLVGTATPADLIQDPRTTPFNIGRRIELTDFSEKEAALLTNGLGRDANLAARLLQRILYWTNGHPYLTQLLCQAVAKDGSVTDPGGVDRHCEELFLSPRARERDDNLQLVHKRMIGGTKDVAGLLDLYAKVHSRKRVRDDETNPLVNTLRLAGVTGVTNGYLRVRNRIYAQVFDRKWITDNMPDAETRRRRTAFRKGAMIATAVALPIILAGLWYLDAYYWERIEYHAAVRVRWGGPEGVKELTDDEVRHRQATIKLVRQGRRNPVRELFVVNSRGKCPSQPIVSWSLGFLNPLENKADDSSEALTESAVTCRFTFEHDAQGRVLNQRAYNRNNRLLYELQSSSTDPNAVYYRHGDSPETRRESGITHIKFKRADVGPEAGLDQEVLFWDQNQPRPNRDGSYGVRRVFNERGLPVEVTNLGANGEPVENRRGVAKEKLESDERGNVTKATTFRLDGEPMPTKGGIVTADFAYDLYGNLSRMSFLGLNGRPVMPQKLGAAVVTRSFDNNGELTELTYLGPDQELVKGEEGFAKIILEHREGNVTLETYFGADNKPIWLDGGFVKGRTVRDNDGNIVETTFLDEKGHPIRIKNGFVTARWKYDRGNKSEVAYFDEKDQPTRTSSGYAVVRWEYDDRGNNIKSEAFGPDGEPALVNEQYVKVERQYNGQNKLIEESYFDKDGKLTKTEEEYAKIKQGYDQNGNPTELAYFNENNQPTRHRDGHAKLRVKYDEWDNIVEKIFLDEADRPVSLRDGFAKVTLKYNERDNQTEVAYFDENDHPVLNKKEGQAKAQWKYDDQNRITEIALFGIDGALMNSQKFGWAIRRLRYDDGGNVSEISYLDSNGQLARNSYGYALRRMTYNPLNRETSREYLDENREAVHTQVTVDDVKLSSKGQRTGLQEGDIIISYDGKDPVNVHVFDDLLTAKGEGLRELKILRNGKEENLKVDPGRIDGVEWIDRVSSIEKKAPAQQATR